MVRKQVQYRRIVGTFRSLTGCLQTVDLIFYSPSLVGVTDVSSMTVHTICVRINTRYNGNLKSFQWNYSAISLFHSGISIAAPAQSCEITHLVQNTLQSRRRVNLRDVELFVVNLQHMVKRHSSSMSLE